MELQRLVATKCQENKCPGFYLMIIQPGGEASTSFYAAVEGIAPMDVLEAVLKCVDDDITTTRQGRAESMR